MPIKPVQRITSWSFSRWSTWKECPLRAKYKFIDKLKEPGSAAMQRGSDIHELAASYVIGTVAKLPEELKLFKKEFSQLKKEKALAEMDAAFTLNWDSCESTDWDNAWVRVKLDSVTPPTKKEKVVHIIDYKTGRVKDEDYHPQMELYGIAGLLKFPQAETAETDLWFLDAGVIRGAHDSEKKSKTGYVFTRKQLPALIEKWEERVRPMLTATAFPPNPGSYCKWCAFGKSKGGGCKFG